MINLNQEVIRGTIKIEITNAIRSTVNPSDTGEIAINLAAISVIRRV